jgi:hypothetical protein
VPPNPADTSGDVSRNGRGGQAPRRPYLIEAARNIQDDIETAYLLGVERILVRNGLT